MLLSLVVAGYAWLGRGARDASLAFAARDFVLITAFENRTGDPLFDGTVEYAFARELSNSTFVNIVPRVRIQDTLELMRRPMDTRLDPDIGREIALRDGHIPVLLAGRVERFETRYVLTANILKAADGSIVASAHQEGVGQAAVLDAIGRLAFDVRRRLGESLESAQADLPQFPRVTTASLRALQLYTQALNAIGWNENAPINRAAAEQLLRQALAIDPEFARAHMTLTSVAGMRPEDRAAMWRHVELALAAAAAVPEVERLVIQAEAELFRGQHLVGDDGVAREEARVRAVAALEGALRIQPDHLFALDRLLAATRSYADGRMRAREVALRYAELRPTNAGAQVDAARVSMDHVDVVSARRYVERARALDVPPAHMTETIAVWLALFDANEAWLANDVRRALAVADEFASNVQQLSSHYQQRAAVDLSFVYLSLGRLQQSEHIVAQGPTWLPETVRDQHRGRVIALRGNQQALAAFLSNRFRTPEEASFVASNLMDAGLLDMGRKVIEYHRRHRNAVTESYEGQLALAEGRIDEAMRKLSVAAQLFAPMNNQGLKIARQRADASHAAGRVDEAIRILEESTRQRSELVFAWEWLRSRDRLSELYRAASRMGDADACDRELAALVAVADDDHFIRRRLTARSK